MDFLTSLFTSIFTPGPTPTLVRATNISFASLQLVLFVLLIATYSIHFLILSFLCAGLWGGVNWFVRELEEANQKERDKEAEKKRRLGETGGVGAGSEGDDEEGEGGSGTETEDVRSGAEGKQSSTVGGMRTVGGDTGDGDVKQTLRPEAVELRRRKQSFGEGSSQGELSTDSEWDKVEEVNEYKR